MRFVAEALRKKWMEFIGGPSADLQFAEAPPVPEGFRAPPEISSPERLKEWAQARKSEAELREKLLGAGVADDRIQFSVSHSRGWVLVVAAEMPEGHRLGVDLETSSRPISAEVLQKFQDSSEERFGLTGLELWVIKEACFKATPENKGLMISQYLITHYSHEEGRAQCKQHRLEFRLVRLDQWLIAFAKSVP